MALSKITTASLADDSVSTNQIANNASISTSGSVTTTGAFTSVGIDDNADANAVTIDSSERLHVGTESLTSKLNVVGDANTTGVSIKSGGNGSVHPFQVTWATGAEGAMLKVDDNGNTHIGIGNLVIGTSGKGIDFSATGEGSSTSSENELFDDYEEGTWQSGSAVGGLNAESGSVIYAKVGRMVHFHVKGSFNNSSNAEDVEITGLPYAPSINQVAGSAMWRNLGTNGQGGVVYVKTNGRIKFYDDGTTATAHNVLRHNEIGSANEVVLSGTYFTNS